LTPIRWCALCVPGQPRLRRRCNRGLEATEAEFVLISNPDVSVHPGALTALMAAFDDDPPWPSPGRASWLSTAPATVGPSVPLHGRGRRPYLSSRLVAPQNRFSRRYRMANSTPPPPHRPVPSPHRVVRPQGPDHGVAGNGPSDQGVPGNRVPVDWVSGGLLHGPPPSPQGSGRIDESYFMYLRTPTCAGGRTGPDGGWPTSHRRRSRICRTLHRPSALPDASWPTTGRPSTSRRVERAGGAA